MTTFTTILNNLATGLGSPYVAGSGSVTLSTGYGATITAMLVAAGQPSVSTTHRLRVTLFSTNAKTLVFEATAFAGDVLTGSVVEGTDQAFPVVDLTATPPVTTQVLGCDTAAMARRREAAIGTLEAGPGAATWVPAATGADQSVAIQAAHDAAPAGASALRFPPGQYNAASPLYFDRSNVNVEFAGRGATNLSGGPFGGGGGIVIGLRRVYLDGRKVGVEHRPDCHGILDSGAAPSVGSRAGLSTQGNIGGVMVARDRMETWTGITVQLAISTLGLSGAGQAIAGYDPTRGNGPYFLGTYLDPTVFKLMVWWGDGSMTECHVTVGAQAAMVRLRIWLDFASGTFGATRDGSTVTMNLNGGPSFAGKTLLGNRTNLSFMLATADWMATTSGGTPNFTLYGARFSKLAITTEPANDLARYFNESVNDALLFPFTDTTPARHVKVDLAGAFNNLFLPHSNGLDTFPVDNVRVSRLSIGGVANGILLGYQQHTQIDDVGALCDSNGLATLPIYFGYPLKVTNCEFAGQQAGVTLAQTEQVSFVAVDIKGGGPYTQACFRGCSVNWLGGMLFFPSGVESYIDMWNGDYGGVYYLRGILADSEGAGILVAGIRCEEHAQCQTDLEVGQFTFGTLGSPAVAIQLTSHTGSQYKGAAVRAYGLLSGDATAAGAVRAINAPGWYGEIDARGLTVRATLGGTAAANLTVRTS